MVALDSTGSARPEYQDQDQPSEDDSLIDQVIDLIFDELSTTDLFSPEQIQGLRQLADTRRLHRPDPVIDILEAE